MATPDTENTDLIAIILRHLDPSSIYPMAFDVGSTLWPVVGMVLMLAILFRAVSDMYSGAATGQFDWAKIFLDIFLWGALLISYLLIVIPVVDYFNWMYTWFDENGSLNSVTLKIADTVNNINQLKVVEPQYVPDKDATAMGEFFGKEWHDLKEGLASAAGYTAYGAAFTAYLVTFTIVASVGAFLDIGHAFLFNLTYIWGMFAIPLSITSNVKLVGTWFKTAMFVLIWPLFTALIIFFFQAIFIGAADSIAAAVTEYSVGMEAGFYIGFAILNLVIAGSLIAAPFITQAFIMGTGLTPALFSFASAGVAAGVMASRAALAPYKVGKSAMKTVGERFKQTSFNRNISDLSGMIQNPRFWQGAGKGKGNDNNTTPPGGGSKRTDKPLNNKSVTKSYDLIEPPKPGAAASTASSSPTHSGSAGGSSNSNTHLSSAESDDSPTTSTVAAVSSKRKRSATEQRKGVMINKAIKKSQQSSKKQTEKI